MFNVNTNQFEAAHGRKPRGTGWWVFDLDGSDEQPSPIRHTTRAAYGEAKRSAIKLAKEKGYSKITLCS